MRHLPRRRPGASTRRLDLAVYHDVARQLTWPQVCPEVDRVRDALTALPAVTVHALDRGTMPPDEDRLPRIAASLAGLLAGRAQAVDARLPDHADWLRAEAGLLLRAVETASDELFLLRVQEGQ